MKYRVENPEHLLDINALDFSEISTLPEGGIRLGATSTNADTAYHEQIEKNYPLLSKAILSGASTQLRNMATDGGNLMQRTRCYYFYDTATPCNKREPGSGCSAINGFNRIHAILGTSDTCIATHPSDMCVALAALDATVQVTGENGSRSIPFLEFHRLPGENPERDTNLEPGELITAIDLPEKGFSEHFEYLKVRDRPSYAFASVSVAAALEMDGENIKDIRVALGGVAHKPWRLPEVEKDFFGKKPTRNNFEELAEKLIAGAKGYGDNDFKIDLAKKSIVRALLTALDNKK
jgi:xanthine dehydrogenase YagS FAD-binding subunit